jgi:imidazole glycerol-phosphate synthase subunit HisH
MTVGIIDYGLGNLTSVEAAVGRLGCEAVVSSDPAELGKADKLILPGVGAFGDGMRNLRERGLVEPLTQMVKGAGKPILGICLGFQLIARESEEFGRHDGLAWVDGAVVQLAPSDEELRVPHVGWNDLIRVAPSALYDGLPDDALFYYVHSFRLAPVHSEIVIGECDYGGRFAAAIRQDNIWAVQFHPEKSQQSGLRLLRNFLEHGAA